MNHMFLSKEGIETLKKRLNGLKEEYAHMRMRIAEGRQLKDAEEGDLLDEMSQWALLEKQIRELSQLLSRAIKHVAEKYDGRVQLGSIVRLLTPWGRLQYKVVSAAEADPAQGKISDVSPLGSALLGKAAKALVKVQGPRQTLTYKVLGVGAE